MFTIARYALPALSVAAVFTPLVASAGEVYHREMYQQQRIFNGVKDDQITKGEFHNLERREFSVNAQRVADLRRNDGHLTHQEYDQLNDRLNHISRSIYVDRHN